MDTAIHRKALELGFLDCAVIQAVSLEEEREHLESWIQKDMQGSMGYMARNAEKRIDPRLLVDNAQSIVLVLLNYKTNETQTDREAPVLSKYAFGTDYHFVVKEKLQQLFSFIRDNVTPCNGRIFTDSAPVLERAWGRKAGLGWIGKNSCLISHEGGSFFFIGEIIVDAILPYDERPPVSDYCGRCTRCIDACPTQAIVAPKVIDARKCISYQTIELKGDLDHTLRGKFQNRVFGCDICQDVCPWNLKPEVHAVSEFRPIPELMQLTAEEWHTLSRDKFNQLFSKSPVKRTGYEGVIRNLKFLTSDDGKTV